MPADPNIILSAKAPDINPLDTMAKAYSIKNLMAEGQMNQIKLGQAQRDANDQQSLRSAYKNNTQTSPDGTLVVDRQGMMKDLIASNPMLAQKQEMDFRQMDLDKLNQQHSAGKSILFGPMDTQDDLDNARSRAQKLGLPPLPLPATIDDPNFQTALRSSQIKSLTAEEQLAQANKQQEFSMQKQKNDVELAKLGQEQAHYQNDKQMKAVEDYNAGVSGSRQQPDAAKELLNVQSAKNINEIISQAPKDPKTGAPNLNGLNNQQTKLAMMEVVKMAGGSVPTEGELNTMTPDGIAQKYGGLLQNVTNKSQPANAGEFLQQGINYANGIAGVSKNSLSQRSNEMLERLGPFMGQKSKGLIKNQIDHEFDDKNAPAGSTKKTADTSSGGPIAHEDAHATATKILANPRSTPEQRVLAQRALGVATQNMVGQK